jgi:predicted O-methyltransferase YrrM
MPHNKYPYITSPEIRKYCELLSKKPNQHLNDLEKKSAITEQTKMLSGSFLGRLLSMVSKMVSPKTILEIGTFTGYGTLCLAEGLQSGGTLITLEKNENLKEFYNEQLSSISSDKTIIQKLGDAAEIIPTLDYTFDLVFMDAAKRQYKNYYDLLFDKIRPGGIIMADNVLWKGKVVTDDVDKLGKGLMLFNEYIVNDDRVDNILLPIDDGVNLIRKKLA